MSTSSNMNCGSNDLSHKVPPLPIHWTGHIYQHPLSKFSKLFPILSIITESKTKSTIIAIFIFITVIIRYIICEKILQSRTDIRNRFTNQLQLQGYSTYQLHLAGPKTYPSNSYMNNQRVRIMFFADDNLTLRMIFTAPHKQQSPNRKIK